MAEAFVGDIGGARGSRYEVVAAKEYGDDRLVRDGERGKCEHLQNVRLEHPDDKMFVCVDDRRVELEEYRLSTSGSHIIMRGKLDGKDDCKVELDGSRASVRFGRDYLIEGMRKEGDDILVRNIQSKNQKREHRIYLEHFEEPDRPSLNQFGRPEMLEHVKIFDRPKGAEGPYQFVLDRPTQNEICRLLADAEERRGAHERDKLKGDIAEVLAPNLLELAGWERIKRHPFNKTRKDGVSSNGTDWLLWDSEHKLSIEETKWYERRTDAIKRAAPQVGKDFDDYPYYRGSKIEGGYIVIVDWKMDDSPFKVYVKKVRPKDEMRKWTRLKRSKNF